MKTINYFQLNNLIILFLIKQVNNNQKDLNMSKDSKNLQKHKDIFQIKLVQMNKLILKLKGLNNINKE
jgi:hypothetical protein